MITIKDIDLTNKKVLIRCDLNVPIKDNKIQDDNRILMSIKTIEYVLKYASNVIIISHLGRIKTKEDLDNNSLRIVCDRLSELLNKNIKFCTYDEDINKAINENKIVMLENTRYFDIDNNKESNNDEDVSKFFASLADIYINDAFGVCHREAASVVGVAHYIPSAIGFLVEEEVNKLSELFNPERPFSIILGGSKVSDKIGVISNLIEKADNIIIVGAMAFTFLKAKNINIANSILDEESIDYCKDLLNKYSDKILLPSDVYVSDDINSDKKELVDINNIHDIGFDIGPNTVKEIKEKVSSSKTVFVNGPAGVFENPTFSYGTSSIFEILSNINGKVIVGGGDSAAAAIKFVGRDKFYHISTGGGASLEFLEGKTLPGLKYIGEKNEEV